MWHTARPSWQVFQDVPEDLHLVLYVRDLYRLDAGGPGRLQPMPADRSDDLDESTRATARDAWPAWWESVLEAHRTHARPLPPNATRGARRERVRLVRAAVDPPGFATRGNAPALQRAARGAFEPFLDWWSPQAGALGDPVPRRRQSHVGGLGLPGVRGRVIDLQLGYRTVTDVVRRLEKDLGHAVAHFDFSIELLAIDAPRVVEHEAHHAVVAASLAADLDAFEAWLYTALSPLA